MGSVHRSQKELVCQLEYCMVPWSSMLIGSPLCVMLVRGMDLQDSHVTVDPAGCVLLCCACALYKMCT